MTAANIGHIPATYTSFLEEGGLKGARFGVIREPFGADTDPEAADFKQVWSVIDRALSDLTAQGATMVDPITIPGLRDLLAHTTGTYETEAATNAYLAAHPHAPARTLAEIVLSEQVLPSRRMRMLDAIGRTTNDLGYLTQIQAREELRRAVLVLMADNDLDALVYPTFAHEPRVIPADFLTTKSLVQPGNNRTLAPMLAFPAISVPAGFIEDGLPVGIEFMGRPFTEGPLLKIAYGYEQTTHHRHPPSTTPPLPGEP